MTLILIYFDSNKKIRIETDILDFVVAAILSQKNSKGI